MVNFIIRSDLGATANE